MQAGPGCDQQFTETEMIATLGFDGPAVDIDSMHTRSQMDLNIPVAIERKIMNQKFRLIGTLEKKLF